MENRSAGRGFPDSFPRVVDFRGARGLVDPDSNSSHDSLISSSGISTDVLSTEDRTRRIYDDPDLRECLQCDWWLHDTLVESVDARMVSGF